ncbi:uncharacterized protein FIBRA_04411 [Fibroporia radiculosa]|uniref:GRAM domain-containing protein n=1 Tax=Fibroporia radiculosa TaxID=599839 RepID=J4H2Y2_9APHY|nr:uncharacterized protein FIBRA_04411 [Fibroporia radiculosa]CCM02319.1 predicted protein [Fibroporia radiculosa]
MALNYAMLSPSRSPIPLPHELTIRTVDSGVELSLTVPDAPPSRSADSGGSGGAKKLKDVGRLWLTDQRLIFVSDGTSKSSPLESLSVSLTSLLTTRFEQPIFGSNSLLVDIKPAPEGGLTDGTKAEIRFKDKGLFEFVGVLEKTRERAVYMKRQMADEHDSLPTYTPAEAGPSYSAGVPDDAPPGYDA